MVREELAARLYRSLHDPRGERPEEGMVFLDEKPLHRRDRTRSALGRPGPMERLLQRGLAPLAAMRISSGRTPRVSGSPDARKSGEVMVSR